MTIDANKLNDLYSYVRIAAVDYDNNEGYVEGQNPTIMNQLEKKKPDNRFSACKAKETIDFLTGYAGRTIGITYKPLDESDTANDEYIQMLKEFEDYNDDDILLPTLYRETIAQKEAYLLFWESDNLDKPGVITPEYDMIECNRGVMVYDDKIKPNKVAFVLFTAGEEDLVRAQVYYPLSSEAWTSKKGDGWARDAESDTTYVYTTVPAIRFRMSRKGGPVFQAGKGLLDQIDKIITKSADELERFANITLMMPEKVEGDYAEKLRTAMLTLIDDLAHLDSDKWPRYLEKNLAGVEAYRTNLLKELNDYYHSTVGIPNVSDPSFAGGDESGVARAFKLLATEYLAAGIELYFFKGLYERKALFDDIIKATLKSIDTTNYTLDVKAERKLPMDEAVKANVAIALKGFGLSDETILEKILGGIVDDVDAEIERMAANKTPVMIIDDEETPEDDV